MFQVIHIEMLTENIQEVSHRKMLKSVIYAVKNVSCIHRKPIMIYISMSNGRPSPGSNCQVSELPEYV